MLQPSPARKWGLIMDALSTPLLRASHTAWLAWPAGELWWLPTEACGPHLREPWWQQLRPLARKGCRGADVEESIAAVVEATASWNQHRAPYIWNKALCFRKRTT